MRIISAVLILITAFFSFKHGWAGLTMNMKPGEPDIMTALGIGRSMLYLISFLTLAGGILILFPLTFFVGNVLNAAIILLILCLQLNAGNMKASLIEIPFLLMPLVMIYFGHPLKR